jgi:hypothetical protein
MEKDDGYYAIYNINYFTDKTYNILCVTSGDSNRNNKYSPSVSENQTRIEYIIPGSFEYVIYEAVIKYAK